MSDAKSEARKAASKAGTTVSGGHPTAGTSSGTSSGGTSSGGSTSGTSGGKSDIQKTLELEKISPTTVTPSQYEGLSDAAKSELQKQGYVAPPKAYKPETNTEQFYYDYLKSQGLTPDKEALKQAELQGVTVGGKFQRELSQREFEGLSPSLRKEYNKQAEQSQKDYEQYKEQEKRQKEIEENYSSSTIKVGSADVPVTAFLNPPDFGIFSLEKKQYTSYQTAKSDFITGQTTEVKGEYLTPNLGKDIEQYDVLTKQFKEGGSTDEKLYEKLKILYETINVELKEEEKARKAKYERELTSSALDIVRKGTAQGATKVQIYTSEGKAIGALSIKGAVEPLKYLLRTGEFQVSYTIPKTPEQRAEAERIKEQNKQFKTYLATYQKIGATFDITKNGQLVAVTSKEHPYFDVLKAQKEYGEVKVSPTKTNYITGERLPEIKSGNVEQIAAAPFYNLGEFSYYAPESMIEAAKNIPKEATSITDVYTKGYSPQTTLKQGLQQQRDIGIEYILTGKIPEGFTQQDVDIALMANAALLYAGVGRARRVGAQEWVGIDFAKKPPIKIVEPRSLTPVYKPTNMFRKPIPKDIFEFDTALEQPRVSEAPKRPMEPIFESGKEAVEKARKSQKVLLEPTPPRIEAPPKVLGPRFTQMMPTKGKPPISKPTDIFAEPQEAAAGLYSAQGKITGSITESGLPEGAIIRMRTPRAEIVEAAYIKPEHTAYSAQGKELGIFGERPAPIGAMGKVETYVPKPPEGLRNLMKARGRPPFSEPTEIFGESKLSLKEPTVSTETTEFTFIKPEHEVYSSSGKLLGKFGEIESPTGALGKQIKTKLKEKKPLEPTNIKDFYTRLARTKGEKKPGKIDTAKLLGGETPKEDLVAGIAPIKKQYPKDFNEFDQFQTRIERERQQGITQKEEGIGALGKKTLEQIIQEEKGYKPSLRGFAERLKPNIVKGRKVKTSNEIKKINTEAVLGIEKKTPTSEIESNFRKFFEGTKSLRKEVQEDINYKPNIRQYATKLTGNIVKGKRITPKTEIERIDTNALLADAERPSIGEPKEFTEALPKKLTRVEQKKLRAKQFGKPKTPAWKRVTEPETKGRQQLIQVLKEPTEPGPKTPGSVKIQAKPVGKKLELRSPVRLVVTEHKEEETQVRRNKLRPATKPILITEPKIKEGEKLVGILKPIIGTKGGLKIGTSLETKPRSDVLTRTETIQTPKEEERVRLTPKLTPRFAQEMPTPLVPKRKQPLIPSEKQKQPVPVKLIELPPPEPVKIIPIFTPPPPSGRKGIKQKPEKPGLRADFLAGAPESRVVGLYRERDITYGQKRINKLLGQERRQGPKRTRFEKVRSVSLFREKPKRIKQKKERMHKLI